MLCSDKSSIYIYTLATLQLRPLKTGRDLYQSSPGVWSFDEKYFLYSKFQKVELTINIAKYMNDLTAERKDIYIYCIITGRDEKILENEKIPFGGFWLNK